MKKILLMLFAISAVGYSTGQSQAIVSEAGLQVTIGAEVLGVGDRLRITDGVDEIGSIEFIHSLTTAPLLEQSGRILTKTVYAESNLLGATDTSEDGMVSVKDGQNILLQGADGTSLEGTLSATPKARESHNNKYRIPYDITSKLEGGTPIKQNYDNDIITLTFTLKKTIPIEKPTPTP